MQEIFENVFYIFGSFPCRVTGCSAFEDLVHGLLKSSIPPRNPRSFPKTISTLLVHLLVGCKRLIGGLYFSWGLEKLQPPPRVRQVHARTRVTIFYYYFSFTYRTVTEYFE